MKTSIETLHDISSISGIKANERADAAVFVRTEMDADDNSYKSNLYLLRKGEISQLTSGGEESAFVFEDDDNLLFAAARSKQEKEAKESGLSETSFYRICINGGEAVKAFTLPLNVSRIEALTDGKFLVAASISQVQTELHEKSREERLDYSKKTKEENFALEAEEIPFWFNGTGFRAAQSTRLFIYDPTECDSKAKIKPLTESNYDISGFSLHPEEDKLLYFGNFVSPRAKTYETLFELDLETGTQRQIVKDDHLSIYDAFYWNDQITLFASDMSQLGLNQNTHVYVFDEEIGETKRFSEREMQYGNSVGTDVNYGSSKPRLVQDDAVYFLETNWHRSVLMRMDADGAVEPFAMVRGSITGFAFVDEELYVSAFHDMQTSELYKLESYSADIRSELDSNAFGADAPFLNWPINEPEKISSFNSVVPAAIKPERFTFQHEDLSLEGFVLLPPAAREADKKSFPAILDIHGGPKTAYGDIYFHEMQYWLAQGYIVIYTNPRGSDGRNDSFSDIRGDYGGRDFRDIMAFVDASLERYHQIDPERIGVTGGSYGGFMTNWIVTHTDRFKAAATQRSISNWTSFYGVSDIGFRFAFDQNKTSWDDEDVFSTLWDHSPLKYIRSAKTPTLVLHAEEDYRCPLEQGVQFFTALVDAGVAARLVVFNKENHELSRSGKPKARKKRLSEITQWFDKHVR
ncbi:MAG: S9 family peptidase [Eubacteriales bacterium]|nr:S9 family peptidase [Eubacteriales bacterium]MDD4541102.1 S9 family peptidase [Eubacteriales bacterium]